MSILNQRPSSNEYAPYFQTYIDKVPENKNILEILAEQRMIFIDFLKKIPIDKLDYAYENGKWTIKEILQHLIDCERIFCYRALSIARKDITPLPGFDENEYIKQASTSTREWSDMIQEFDIVRQSSLILFKSFSEECYSIVGNANQKPISVRAISFITAGHILHHMQIIINRYL